MVYRVDHWCCHSAISWASLAVRLLAMRAGMLLLLALRRAAAAEPCALCMAAHPNHPFKWGRCMPPRDQCSPPKGVELLVVRGTGNKWFAEDFLDQLRYFAHGSRHLDGACPQSSTWRWTEARTTVFVAPGLRAPPGLFTLPISGRERASYVAILRHPVLRVVSRYWFEGAWGQHQAEKGRPRPLGARTCVEIKFRTPYAIDTTSTL